MSSITLPVTVGTHSPPIKSLNSLMISAPFT
jgi:hypothetical protein